VRDEVLGGTRLYSTRQDLAGLWWLGREIVALCPGGVARRACSGFLHACVKHSAALRCRCSEEVFEDEDTKSFYEGLPNLKMQIPGYLLTQLAAASEKDDAEEGEKVRTDPVTSALGSPCPHLQRCWAHRCRMRYATGLIHPHLHRDSADLSHICSRIGLTPATPAPGLGPHLLRDWALTPATSAPGSYLPLPHLHRDCRASLQRR
jgi:hypothetical protein